MQVFLLVFPAGFNQTSYQVFCVLPGCLDPALKWCAHVFVCVWQCWLTRVWRVLYHRYRKHTVRIRGSQRHDTAVEPEGIQPRVTHPPPRNVRLYAIKPTSLLIFLSRAPTVCGPSLYWRRRVTTSAGCDSVPGRPHLATQRTTSVFTYARRRSSTVVFCDVNDPSTTWTVVSLDDLRAGRSARQRRSVYIRGDETVISVHDYFGVVVVGGGGGAWFCCCRCCCEFWAPGGNAQTERSSRESLLDIFGCVRRVSAACCCPVMLNSLS